ncbi:hypothetical protein PF007_g31199, partial [Phytophthora fragariae]
MPFASARNVVRRLSLGPHYANVPVKSRMLVLLSDAASKPSPRKKKKTTPKSPQSSRSSRSRAPSPSADRDGFSIAVEPSHGSSASTPVVSSPSTAVRESSSSEVRGDDLEDEVPTSTEDNIPLEPGEVPPEASSEAVIVLSDRCESSLTVASVSCPVREVLPSTVTPPSPEHTLPLSGDVVLPVVNPVVTPDEPISPSASSTSTLIFGSDDENESKSEAPRPAAATVSPRLQPASDPVVGLQLDNVEVGPLDGPSSPSPDPAVLPLGSVEGDEGHPDDLSGPDNASGSDPRSASEWFPDVDSGESVVDESTGVAVATTPSSDSPSDVIAETAVERVVVADAPGSPPSTRARTRRRTPRRSRAPAPTTARSRSSQVVATLSSTPGADPSSMRPLPVPPPVHGDQPLVRYSKQVVKWARPYLSPCFHRPGALKCWIQILNSRLPTPQPNKIRTIAPAEV